jgi:hypothetical protein
MPIAGEADAAPTILSKTISRFGLLALATGIPAAAVALVSAPIGSVLISQYFLMFQDAPVLLLLGAFLLVTQALLSRRLALATPGWVNALHARPIVWATVGVVGALIYAGTRFVCRNYGLSLDEFMAEFDSRIIAGGNLIAPVGDEWRDLVPALQPIFRLPVPENAYWVSSYLPTNAAIRGVFLWLGDPTWAGVSLAATALATLFAIVRQLWPDRPDAAVISVILLASSAQFLVAAMTPYAMTAHLCLNLVWLWLFLRNRWWGHVAAVAVAFVASGLHKWPSIPCSRALCSLPFDPTPLVASHLLRRHLRLHCPVLDALLEPSDRHAERSGQPRFAFLRETHQRDRQL